MHFVYLYMPIISINEAEHPILDSLHVAFRDKNPRRSGVGNHWPWPNVYVEDDIYKYVYVSS